MSFQNQEKFSADSEPCDSIANYMKSLKVFVQPDFNEDDDFTSAEYYYDAQSHFLTHEYIVNDKIVMNTFSRWILDNTSIFKDQVVLDVGCGCGIFSMIAARAGASRVISIEWSNITKHTRKIIQDNKLDNIITVVKSKIEDLKHLPHGIQKVDVIISLWMGYSLFQGGRIQEVIRARDKWLKPNGTIVPDVGELYISGISNDDFRENKLEWWKNVYGYDMSCVAEDFLRYVQYSALPEEKIVTNRCMVKSLNLNTITENDLMGERAFALTATKNDYIQGFCTYFTVKFSKDTEKTVLSTSPMATGTHWGQSCFYLKDYIMIKKKERITGTFELNQISHDNRYYEVSIGVDFQGKYCSDRFIKQFVLKPC